MASTAPNDDFCRCNRCHDPKQHYYLAIRHRIMTKATALLQPFIKKVSNLPCVCVRVFLIRNWHSDFSPCSFCRFIKILLLHAPDYCFTSITGAGFACSLACFFILLRCLRTRKHCWRLHHGDRDDAGAGDHLGQQESVPPSLRHCDASSQQGATY